MSDSRSPNTQETIPSPKRSHSASNQVEAVFESVVFASRLIHAPLYAGLIIAELLYAYKFLH